MGRRITSKYNLQLDREFASIVPARSKAERVQLEEHLTAHGCPEPLIVWKDAGRGAREVLAVDYECYRLCLAHGISFRVKRMNFKDRDEVKEFIINRALSRLNLNLYQKCLLALKWKQIVKERGRENMRLSCGRGKKVVRKSIEPFQPHRTNAVLAAKVGVSADTIAKVTRLQKKANEGLKRKLESGRITIHGACRLVDSKEKAERRIRTIKSKSNYRNPIITKEPVDVIICADVLLALQSVPDDWIDLIVTSPPYCTNIDYGKGRSADNLRYEEWLDWLTKVWHECERVLVPGGRLCVNVASTVNRYSQDKDRERKRPVVADLIGQMRNVIQMKYRDRITWVKNNVAGNQAGFGSYCSPCDPLLRHTSEDIIVWSKGSYELLPPKPGIVGDITDEQFREYTCNTWPIPADLRNGSGHPCVFPEELVRRLVLLYSYPTSLVLDCFNGSGTTTAVAASLGRRYIGIDQSRAYCAYARKRTVRSHAKAKKTPIAQLSSKGKGRSYHAA